MLAHFLELKIITVPHAFALFERPFAFLDQDLQTLT
tara:strand:- start:864 stop:971 length:108 start_codon:yes stop_codon:yes gene_type:complete